jgi:hypothetical protein
VSRVRLRASLIWLDEVMGDVVLDKPEPITLGDSHKASFVVPEIGLPQDFAILRPGNRGFLLTLADGMRGHHLHRRTGARGRGVRAPRR